MVKFCYFLGLALALLFKVGYSVYHRPMQGGAVVKRVPVKTALLDFFFKDANSAGATLVTIAVAWVAVAAYVGEVEIEWLGAVEGLPEHNAVAFLLGVAIEAAAPPMFKALITRLSGGV